MYRAVIATALLAAPTLLPACGGDGAREAAPPAAPPAAPRAPEKPEKPETTAKSEEPAMPFLFSGKKTALPSAAEALPGRAEKMPIPAKHYVSGEPLDPPAPGLEVVQLGMGCFWGAERRLWQQPGVVVTAVGYAGGQTPNPTYHEVCTGRTGHTEVVRVAYDPRRTSLEAILRVFWESHDPTQGMRQGNDVGTQYRSAIYVTTPEQRRVADASRDAYQTAIARAGLGKITTEVRDAPPFYFAEEYHQQYLAKNPDGYCGLAGTGVECPVGTGVGTGGK